MAGTAISIFAVTAVHGFPRVPLAAALYADAVIGLCWLVAAVLLLRRPPPDSPGGDASGPGHHRAVRFSTDREPLARSHWGSRYRL
ncbi:hypothetical protein [Streptomyces sp. NPDC007346]|uniref:hypothetical protein n=1 Tax=Streptomyces sp. NPDC007346 TaxID=3154682 RepID=UPI0034528451